MLIDLGQDAIDLGIVITDSDRALGFYRDLLGMEHEGDMPVPAGGGGVMHRLRCGSSLIKLVRFADVPASRPAPGGLTGGTGYRYFTIHATNLAEVMDACAAAGVNVVVPPTQLRPGVTIGIVEDPDGNWVEFVDYG